MNNNNKFLNKRKLSVFPKHQGALCNSVWFFKEKYEKKSDDKNHHVIGDNLSEQNLKSQKRELVKLKYEELQYLLHIKKLQDEVITLRTEIPAIYSKYFKRSQSIQLKRLLKVQINIPVTEIEIPDQASLPTANRQIQPKLKTDDIEKECLDLAKVIDFI